MAVSGDSDAPLGHSLFIDEPKIGRLSLDFDKYVASITELIVSSDPQFTIGVFGDWGTGKSTILRNIRQKLEKKYRCVCLEFDAWQYEQETAQMSIPLILAIIAEIYKNNKDKIDNFDRESNENFKEKLSRIFSGLSLSLKFGIPGMADLGLGYDFSKVLDNGSRFRFLSTRRRIERFSLEQTKLQEGIDLIKKLIDMNIVKGPKENQKLKLVVFIDDLDRCTPEKAVEIFEVVKIFLGIKGIVYVIGLSQKIVKLAIDEKYKHLRGQFSGEEYLRKIIQLQFPIPQIQLEEVTDYIVSLLDEYEDLQYHEFFSKNRQLIALGMEPNPRQIKRYLNNFILSFEIAKRRHQSSTDEETKFLAFNIIRQRWEWFYNAFFSDKEFPKKIRRIIIEQQEPDPNDTQVREILTDPALYNFLKSMAGKIIFDISEDEQGYYKKATSDIDLVQPQEKKSKEEEEKEKESQSVLISKFLGADQDKQEEVWRIAERDPDFAYNLGYSSGTGFSDMKSDRREKIFEMVAQNDAFAKGLGSSLGREFARLPEDLQDRIFDLAKKKDEFAQTLGSSLGTHYNFLSPKIEERVLRVAENNSAFAKGLGRALNRVFSELDKNSKKQVWNLVEKNEHLASNLGYSLGENFAMLDVETSEKALQVAEVNPAFASELARFLGRDFVWQTWELRERILEVTLRSKVFAERFWYTLIDKITAENPKLQEIIMSQAGNFMKQSSDRDMEKELIELNIRIGEAEKELNEAFLERVLADDLILRRASGKIENKKEYLESVRNPDSKFEYLISQDVKPTIYGNVAIVRLRVRVRGLRGRRRFDGIYSSVRFFIKNQGWQCVVWFNSELI
jgi:KAP family P-loop domain/Domain of unknown function (DUF4440)